MNITDTAIKPSMVIEALDNILKLNEPIFSTVHEIDINLTINIITPIKLEETCVPLF